jgi:hypothetical protein
LPLVMLTLVLCALAIMSVSSMSFVELLFLLFGVTWRMCGENSCNVFVVLLFMVLWVPISATLWRRAMLMLWHAFMFLGLRSFPLFFFLLGGLLFLIRIFNMQKGVGGTHDARSTFAYLLENDPPRISLTIRVRVHVTSIQNCVVIDHDIYSKLKIR